MRRELPETASELSTLVERLRSLSARATSKTVRARAMEEILRRSEELAAAARREHRLRRMREEYIACSLLGEPAWDMLLDLFAHSVRGEKVPVSSACVAAHCPPTTALRYIDMLVQEGFIMRSADKTDKRPVLLTLSRETLVSIGSFLIAMSDED